MLGNVLCVLGPDLGLDTRDLFPQLREGGYTVCTESLCLAGSLKLPGRGAEEPEVRTCLAFSVHCKSSQQVMGALGLQ